MKTTRKIILIDEDKCSGCGQCILACAEGALRLVDGKAKLVGDVFCDGLGACIGECPEDALHIVEREADEFDEHEVEKLLAAKKAEEEKKAAPAMACGCPGHLAMDLKPAKTKQPGHAAVEEESELTHWPIKLKLIQPSAPFLKGKDLVLLADCAAASLPGLHRKLLADRAIAMACPKFDDLDEHVNKLTEILKVAKPSSVTVVHMEVPCCGGIVWAIQEAVKKSGTATPLERMKIGRNGQVLEREKLAAGKAA